MQYILPMARNLRTGQRVQQQDLSGRKYRPDQVAECRLIAEKLARDMTARSSDTWQALVETVSSSQR